MKMNIPYSNETQMMLRLPMDVKRKLKVRCAEKNISMNETLIKLIKEYLEKNGQT